MIMSWAVRGDRRPVIDLGGVLLSLVLLTCSAASRPRVVRCPVGWYLDGVRPTGVGECLRVPGGDPRFDGAGGAEDRAVDFPGRILFRVRCPTGQVPIVVLSDPENRTAGCSRPPG